MYLGHVLDQSGGNMKNILHKKNKAIGTQRMIPKLIKNLGKFTFEGAVIYIESLIRSSILYGSETMFNIKENDYRTLEAMEEAVLQKTFQTLRSCSRHLLYLESGMIPARYQIHRQMLNYIQYILLQPSDSLLSRVFFAQKTHHQKMIGSVVLPNYLLNRT